MPNGGQFGQHDPQPPLWEQVRQVERELKAARDRLHNVRAERDKLKDTLAAAEQAFAQQIARMSVSKEKEDD